MPCTVAILSFDAYRPGSLYADRLKAHSRLLEAFLIGAHPAKYNPAY